MHEIEIERGFRGIRHNLSDLLFEISSDHRWSPTTVFIHGGVYQIWPISVPSMFHVPSNTHLIGIGSSTLSNPFGFRMDSGCYHFENINFVARTVCINDAKVTFEKCTFSPPKPWHHELTVNGSSSLNMDSCHFMNGLIRVWAGAVTVRNTTFSGNELDVFGCIDVDQCERLIVENNTFENIKGIPVVNHPSTGTVSECVLKGNRLNGYQKCKYDPNVLYKNNE